MLYSHAIKNSIKTLIPDSILTHRLPAKAANTILLTFDDGPDEEITPVILKQLKKFNVRAIFFAIGKKIEQFPHIIQLITEQGHLIGNHTYSHPYQEIPSRKHYSSDVLRCQDIIESQTGKKSSFYRPPAGIISISGLLMAKQHQLKTILWSIEGGEWGVNKNDSAQIIGERLKQQLKPQDIVLLHDNNDKVPLILDIILPELKKQRIDLHKGVNFLCL